MRAGANGYILKNSKEEILSAVRAVAAGGPSSAPAYRNSSSTVHP
jgi:DNA-binding NarL/FixJ family response regulator